jgi:hypothetical protein
MVVNDIIVPIRPKDRYKANKLINDRQYKQSLADNYMKRYTDISHETADFYK